MDTGGSGARGILDGQIGRGLALVASTESEREVNLDYAATTPALQAVVDAVVAFVPAYGSVHRGGGRRSAISTAAYEVARRSVAGFVGCPAGSSTIFVRNTTEAANLLAAALSSRARGSSARRSSITRTCLPWRIHRVRHLQFARSADELLARVERALADARAAGEPFDLLAVSGASNVTGEVTPLAELASTAHAYGAKIFVDAAQLAPHRPIDMGRSDVDFLAFSGHKLYAPFGTGALLARDEALGGGLPLLRGGGAVKLVSLDEVAWASLPHRYEAGTPNTIGAVAPAARRAGRSRIMGWSRSRRMSRSSPSACGTDSAHPRHPSCCGCGTPPATASAWPHSRSKVVTLARLPTSLRSGLPWQFGAAPSAPHPLVRICSGVQDLELTRVVRRASPEARRSACPAPFARVSASGSRARQSTRSWTRSSSSLREPVSARRPWPRLSESQRDPYLTD